MTLLIVSMGVVTNHLYQKNRDLQKDVKQKDYNISQLESDNYSLNFKKGELEKYIKQGNTEFKRRIDSITKAHDIKIKDLKKVTSTKIETVIDTVLVPVETTINPVDSLYHSAFVMDSACFKIRGKVISNDSMPQIIFNQIGYKNEVMHFVYREPKKWWQIFKRRKLILKAINECGEISVKELIEQ